VIRLALYGFCFLLFVAGIVAVGIGCYRAAIGFIWAGIILTISTSSFGDLQRQERARDAEMDIEAHRARRKHGGSY
jgi:hypothetical protein